MQDNAKVQEIEKFINDNEQAIIDDIAAVVAVRSVEGEAAPGAPYGEGPRKALDTALAIARRMGLATGEDDGHMGWAEVPGGEKGHLATITHLDIVPEGDGWDGDPLVVRQKDGWLLGRGVTDDKGPSIMCLYAAKYFHDKGQPLRYGLRVLLGTNEETGMLDVEHYLAGHEEPLFCFSPDADFPLCNGEKGVYGGNFISPRLDGNIVDFDGGIASNVVPDKAYCVVKAAPAALQNTDRVRVSEQDGLARLDAIGIGGHAARPEDTVNAIGLLVNYLLDNDLAAESEKPFLALLKRLHSVTDGSGIGVDCKDDMFDPLTCIGGMMRMKDGVLRQDINIRFPTATSGSKLTADLQAVAAEYGAAFEVGSHVAEPFYIPADSPAIQTLLSTYNEVTGANAKPFTMGGGTYARHFKHAVSFGPERPDEVFPSFAGPVHGANEGLNIAGMKQAMKIYILALERLQQVDF